MLLDIMLWQHACGFIAFTLDFISGNICCFIITLHIIFFSHTEISLFLWKLDDVAFNFWILFGYAHSSACKSQKLNKQNGFYVAFMLAYRLYSGVLSYYYNFKT